MVVSRLALFRGMLVRGFQPRIGVRGRLFARMTNSEGTELWLGTVNQHGGFCHAPPRPQRGTSPRATFPPCPPLWIPAFAGRSCDLVQRVGMADSAAPHTGPSGGRAPALHSPHPHPLWIPAPYRGTGLALRWNDEMSGQSLSRIGVREVLPCRYEAGPGLESIRSWIRV